MFPSLTLFLSFLFLIIFPNPTTSQTTTFQPPLYPSNLYNYADFTQYLAPQSFTPQFTQTLPVECAVFADSFLNDGVTRGCVIRDMITYSVNLPDCRRSWTVCYCRDSPNPLSVVLFTYSRLPASLRDNLRHFAAMRSQPGPTDPQGGQGQAEGMDLEVFGLITGWQTLTQVISQAVIILDNAKGISESLEWQEAIAESQCVVDEFSQLSDQNALAQAVVLYLYSLFTGNYPSGNSLQTWCIQSQIEFIQNNQFLNENVLLASQCDFQH